jgi:DNA-directed RNA polymerase subunit RPC12/RpoP
MTEAFKGVTWQPNVRCPRCRSKRIMTRRTMPLEKGEKARIRYHQCRERRCKALFKSTENIE